MFEKDCKEFLALTGISLRGVMIDWLSVVSGRPVIDVELLDRALHGIFGHYEERGLTMNDVLQKEYSPEARELINRMLNL